MHIIRINLGWKMKKTYIASLFLSSTVLIFLFMKIIGWSIVINEQPIDKWIALIAVISVPSSVYMIINKNTIATNSQETKGRDNFAILSFILVFCWLGWAFIIQPKYYTYIVSDNILQQPYIVIENRNTKTQRNSYQVINTEYTLFKSVTQILFKKESVVIAERNMTYSLRNEAKTEVIDGNVYITTSKGTLLVR